MGNESSPEALEQQQARLREMFEKASESDEGMAAFNDHMYENEGDWRVWKNMGIEDELEMEAREAARSLRINEEKNKDDRGRTPNLSEMDGDSDPSEANA